MTAALAGPRLVTAGGASGGVETIANETGQELASHSQSIGDTTITASPGDIASGHYRNAIDHMDAAGTVMRNRSIEVPDAGIDGKTRDANHQKS